MVGVDGRNSLVDDREKTSMSRYYHMSVAVTGVAPERAETVKQAAETEWPFEDWYLDGRSVLTASADDNLCGGETEEEFAVRLAKAIWAANGGFCVVEISATYLENVPSETYCLGEDDYHRLTAQPADKPSTPEETSDE
jgi:hypothetical protein